MLSPEESPIMQLSDRELDDFLSLKLPMETTQTLLEALTPECISDEVFQKIFSALKRQMSPVPEIIIPPFMDCCGTGGSGLVHFNTSTISALILACGRVPVLKFGNRSATSNRGSFDFLETIQLSNTVQPDYLPEFVAKTNLAFLFAPDYYPQLAGFSALRKSFGKPTIFNYLGPLLHPYTPSFRLLGVSHPTMQTLIAKHLAFQSPSPNSSGATQIEQAWVVYGHRGLDEMSIEGLTDIKVVKPSMVEQHQYCPETVLPLPSSPLEDLELGITFMKLLSASPKCSPYSEMVCLNAGAGFVVSKQAETIEVGVAMAQRFLKDGSVLRVYQRMLKALDKLPQHALIKRP
ncbi:MAG: hypothetical protein K2X66_18790 [Cyanobacteria bacterium]|nr:hypothetical protein [Cyanobacteriota bacterium]